MDYLTPTIQDLSSLLYGGGGNCCIPVGTGDYNNCSPAGTGTAGCYLVGGKGHTCGNSGSGDTISYNQCVTGMS